MQALIPERNKKPGICYAVTDDGLELPVIDITHPAFEVRATEAEISAVIDETLRALRASVSLPPEVAAQLINGSLLLRGVRDSAGTFMSGMMTYLHRLGPENLGDGYATEVDRRFAAGMMPLSFRLRMRDVARLLSEELQLALASSPARSLEMINIAGGPAMDSVNALILVNRNHPELLRGRAIRIRVLDVDEAGPSFGTRAVRELVTQGSPLEGLDVVLERTLYDWSRSTELRGILARLEAGAIVAGSTEGGLFDYGSDDAIVENLAIFQEGTPSGTFFVGSIVRDVETLDPRLRITATLKNRPAVRYLGEKAFRQLASAAGWAVDAMLDSTAHHVVRLIKA